MSPKSGSARCACSPRPVRRTTPLTAACREVGVNLGATTDMAVEHPCLRRENSEEVGNILVNYDCPVTSIDRTLRRLGEPRKRDELGPEFIF